VNKTKLASLTLAVMALAGCESAVETSAAPTPAVAATKPCAAAPVAHRGGNEASHEGNTRPAWNYSMSKGARIIETDIRFTKDEDPMIMHDPTVDATTNGTGPIADLTYAQVHALRTPKGNYPPTYYQHLTDMVKYGATSFSELKTVPTDAEWTILEQKITSAKMPHNKIVFISFEKDAIAGAHARGYATAWLDNAGDRLPSEIPPGAYLDKTQKSVTQPRTIAWHAAGIKVYAWTVNDVANWHRLGYTDKVDGITTDKPIAYAAWVKGGCKK